MKKTVSFAEAMAGILSVPAIVALNAWSISVMWSWFIVPTGASPIGLVHAIGIGVLVNGIAGGAQLDVKNKSMTTLVILGLGKPFVSLAVGWCVHAFM